MMVAVLLRLKASGMLDEYPSLSAYVARGEARPPYQRAFAAQLAVFTSKPPGRLMKVNSRFEIQHRAPDPVPAMCGPEITR